MRQHERVGKEIFDSGVALALAHDFPFPAKMLWAALLDAPAWKEWLDIEVEWTSPKPFGIGTTRTVKAGSAVVEEYFFRWEKGRRMSFRFERTPLPLKAAAEDYHIVETPGGCRLEFGFAVRAMFPLNYLIRWRMKRGMVTGMPLLEKLLRENPARFGG